MNLKPRADFGDLRVFSPESRHAETMAQSIVRHGGLPVIAQSLREVPLDDPPEVRPFVEGLIEGSIDVVIFLTGVGARTLAAAIADRLPKEPFVAALARTLVVVRGPKPLAALRAGFSSPGSATGPNWIMRWETCGKSRPEADTGWKSPSRACRAHECRSRSR